MVIEKYEKTNWKNDPSTDTPVSAENLNNIEDGIEYNREAIKTINDAINQVDLEVLAEVRSLHDDTLEKNNEATSSKESAAESEALAREYMERASAITDVELARSDRLGIVKPDNESLKVDANGVLSAYTASSTTSSSYDYGYGTYSLPRVAPTGGRVIAASFLSTLMNNAYTAIAAMLKNIYNSIQSKINTTLHTVLGDAKLINRGIIDGVLLANGETYELEPGAMYLLLGSTYLKTNGAYRGMQAYAIGSAWGIGTSTSAQAVARVFALGSNGTVGMNVSATSVASEGSNYISKIGIGSCTTACKVRYALYKIMGSEADF